MNLDVSNYSQMFTERIARFGKSDRPDAADTLSRELHEAWSDGRISRALFVHLRETFIGAFAEVLHPVPAEAEVTAPSPDRFPRFAA